MPSLALVQHSATKAMPGDWKLTGAIPMGLGLYDLRGERGWLLAVSFLRPGSDFTAKNKV